MELQQLRLKLRQLHLELRHLHYFLQVAQKGSFSHAAEELNMTQPPLSQQIRDLEDAISVYQAELPYQKFSLTHQIRNLEEDMRVQLFDRTKRPLQLTVAGQVFLEEVQLVLTQLERAIVRAQRASRGEIGRLAIGTNSSIANSILPDILRLFRDRFPDVELVLQELTSSQQIQQMREDRLNIGFEHLSDPQKLDADLGYMPVLQETLVVALPKHHPLASRSQIHLEALANEPLVSPSPEIVPFYGEVFDLCEQAGFKPKVVQKATWLITVLSLVASGVGVALLPSNAQNLQRTGVVYRAIQGLNFKRQLVAIWRQQDSSPVLREFLKVIQELTRL